MNTQANARACVALDEGSVLNVGSDSSVKVTKHDAGAQQTDLEVAFGKMRSQAQKISKPGGKFEVHSSAGVAGVVGTDFYVSSENNVMTVIVFDGLVKTCNLAGVCVEVKPGQTTTVRDGDSSGPAAPTQAVLSTLTDAVTATNLEGSPSDTSAHHREGDGNHPRGFGCNSCDRCAERGITQLDSAATIVRPVRPGGCSRLQIDRLSAPEQAPVARIDGVLCHLQRFAATCHLNSV